MLCLFPVKLITATCTQH